MWGEDQCGVKSGEPGLNLKGVESAAESIEAEGMLLSEYAHGLAQNQEWVWLMVIL